MDGPRRLSWKKHYAFINLNRDYAGEAARVCGRLARNAGETQPCSSGRGLTPKAGPRAPLPGAAPASALPHFTPASCHGLIGCFKDKKAEGPPKKEAC